MWKGDACLGGQFLCRFCTRGGGVSLPISVHSVLQPISVEGEVFINYADSCSFRRPRDLQRGAPVLNWHVSGSGTSRVSGSRDLVLPLTHHSVWVRGGVASEFRKYVLDRARLVHLNFCWKVTFSNAKVAWRNCNAHLQQIVRLGGAKGR